MNATPDRLDLRLGAEDKARIRRAAALHGMPVAAFVREADTVIVHPRRLARAAWLRGRATARLGTDKIMRLTRGA